MQDLEYEFQYKKMVEYIQYMQNHALIYKFIRMWLFEEAVIQYIQNKWNPKVNVTLELGERGFSIIFFRSLKVEHEFFGNILTSSMVRGISRYFRRRNITQRTIFFQSYCCSPLNFLSQNNTRNKKLSVESVMPYPNFLMFLSLQKENDAHHMLGFVSI